MANQNVKVVYIAGFQRSGSTIIHNILSQVHGIIGVGELTSIWQGALIQRKPCSCGQPVNKCGVWSQVLSDGFGGEQNIDPATYLRLSREVRSRHLLLFFLKTTRETLAQKRSPYLKVLTTLYTSICQVTGNNVIVDSSKSPFYGSTVGSIPGIDVYTIHLVRDPRGIEYSLYKRKLNNHPNFINHNMIKSVIRWMIDNLLVEIMLKRPGKYMRLNYEDFAAEPKATIQNILSFVNHDIGNVDFITGDSAKIQVSHAISGNECRFEKGNIKIQPDVSWLQEFPKKYKILISLLSFPFLRRYGYKFSP